jgi:hypothetical protein
VHLQLAAADLARLNVMSGLPQGLLRGSLRIPEMHLSSDGLVVRVEESGGALGYAAHCDIKLLERLSSIEDSD